MKSGILICGLNGAGKTTIALKLTKITQSKHIDIEDYAFLSSEIPYSRPRSSEKIACLLLAEIEKYPQFIFSAVDGNFGDEIVNYFGFIILVDTPLEIRIERIKKRSFEKFGNRILEGGDLYEQEQKFLDFVANRELSSVENWTKTLNCPVLRIDGTRDFHEMANEILSTIHPHN
jgi:adenylate kinase family enzyme